MQAIWNDSKLLAVYVWNVIDRMYNYDCTGYLEDLRIYVVLSIVANLWLHCFMWLHCTLRLHYVYVLRLFLYVMYSRGPVVLLSRWRIQSDQSESAGVYSCTVNEVMFLLSTSTSNLRKINRTFVFSYISLK